MSNLQYISLILGGIMCFGASAVPAAPRNGTDLGLVWFPMESQQCSCSLPLSCKCCQSAIVDTMNMTKTLCLSFKLTTSPISVDVAVTLDSETVAQFSISALKPPTYCVPMLSLTPVAMCVKMHDIQLLGMTGVQICSTFYTNYNSNEVFAYAFPCVKLTTDGVSMV